MQTMVCIGDSLTEATDIPVGHAWPALVANRLDLKVNNRGIGGDTSAGMLARFSQDVTSADPTFVFIMGGTNDLWWGWETNTILGNLFSMVFQARHHGIAPVIGMPPPVAVGIARQNDFSPPWEGYDRFEEKAADLRKALCSHAGESDVPLVDLQRPFFTSGRKVDAGLYLPDGLHPNRAGQEGIAKAVIEGLCRHFKFRGQPTPP